MTLTEIYKKRKQTIKYDQENYPDIDIVKNILTETFKITASKQNLYPYKVHVLGPNHKNIKKDLYDIICHASGGPNNINVLYAPYCLIFTTRWVNNPDPIIYERIKRGHTYTVCDPKLYNHAKAATCIEVGMFSKILTGLCLEKNINVSYTLCFPDYEKNKDLWKKLSFIKDPVLFSMQLGYRTGLVNYNKEKKPLIDDVISWIED